jgi:4-aminobutyrate aminotransferase-like enzyme
MPSKRRTAGSSRIRQADSKLLGRDEAPRELQVARSEGSILFDTRGRRYIDFSGGWCVGNFGWAHPEIRQRLQTFDGPDYVLPSCLYGPWVELAALLAELTPGQLRKSFRATGGTEAVEIALQLAMAATGRPGFISIEGSYHGHSIGAMSVAQFLGTEALRLPNVLSHCHTIAQPLDDEAAARVEKLLRGKDIAALIMEPIICNLGVLIPEERFMSAVARSCHKYGTLLILDEVACGFGRTGTLFATEHYRVEPDILCLAKAITGGHAPMGATVVTEKVARAAQGKVVLYSTYGWHPLSVEAALATLQYIRRHRRALLANVNARSRDIAERLTQLPFESPAKIRIKGLAIGIEFEDQEYYKGLSDRCLEKGLLVATEAGFFSLFPALTIDRQTVLQGLDILERCL